MIIIAEHAGFCFGVKRAVEMAEKTAVECGKVETLGPLIHNPQEVERLQKLGVGMVDTVNEASEKTMIIRSHGVGASIYKDADRQGLTVVDATCPYVRKIHRIVEKRSNEGYHVVIVGNPIHPEVLGIIGWINGDYTVIRQIDDLYQLNTDKKYVFVAQTTFNLEKWDFLVDEIEKIGLNSIVEPTICKATFERQESTRKLAQKADVMIVIGGKKSSNTQKLYEICVENCRNTIYIEKMNELSLDLIDGKSIVGITAGASTPTWIIDEVIHKIEMKAR